MRTKGSKVRKRKNRGIRARHVLALVGIICIVAWWWPDKPSHERVDPASGERAAQRETQRRAERGDGPAQMELAERHCLGRGVRKNIFQCAEWYRKAANLGNGVAMLRLGDLYASGEGFILDKEAAAMWWRKAESTADGADGAKERLQRLGPAKTLEN